MGALGGILHLTGGEIDPAVLPVLSSLQKQIGPDDEHLVLGTSFAAVFRPFITHPGQCAHRPSINEAGDMVIWNGRLDNADELLTALGPDRPDEKSIAQLAHRCLDRWGLEALPRFMGDFSLAFWRAEPRTLVLATDIWGLRPVFYHRRGDELVWASRCRALVDALELNWNVDPHFAASVLIRQVSGENSPFREIRQVPPAHCLVIKNGEHRLHRYWTPDPSRRLQLSRDEDYEALYLDLLQRSVAARIPQGQAVFADLSGGYDSSSISCLAAEHLRQHQGHSKDLHTVSYVFDRSTFNADERDFIEPVEQTLGRPGTHISNDEAPLLAVPPVTRDFRPEFPTGQLIYYHRNQRVADLMKAQGARVLLRGMGGDQLTWGDMGPRPWEIGDHLSAGHLRKALGAAHRWSQDLRSPIFSTFWRGGLWPLLPRAIQQRTSRSSLQVESWLQPGFVDGIDLRRFALGRPDDVGFSRPSQRAQFTALRDVSTVVGWEFLVRRGSVEPCFPFLDRRLVEFALATPIQRMVRPGQPRYLARRALEGILPEAVRTRTSKGSPDEVIYRTVARRWSELSEVAEDPLVAQHGIVDGDAFRKALQQARHGMPLVTPQLTRTLAFEFWLRSVTHRSSVEAERSSNLPRIPVGIQKE